MKRYIYHYCAIYQPKPGMTTYIDGIIERNCQIHLFDNYRELKVVIAQDNYPADKLTITSLSCLHEIDA
jgi:hypothetical protein